MEQVPVTAEIVRRDENGRFVRGVSGNPAGALGKQHGKVLEAVRAIREHGYAHALEHVEELHRLALESEDERIRVAASREYLSVAAPYLYEGDAAGALTEPELRDRLAALVLANPQMRAELAARLKADNEHADSAVPADDSTAEGGTEVPPSDGGGPTGDK